MDTFGVKKVSGPNFCPSTIQALRLPEPYKRQRLEHKCQNLIGISQP